MDLFGSRLESLREALTDANGDWAIRGFIDVWKTVYPMTPDTKVVSKVIEVVLIPIFLEAIKGTGLVVEFAAHQNHYPDLTIVETATGRKVAVDLKSTYYQSNSSVNGFTLGAFTGYFRDRTSSKNTTYPYGDYEAHLVLGLLYRKLGNSDDTGTYSLDQLDEIAPVAGDFRFILQPKWAIATDRPGSGNTKNIGSIVDVEALLAGKGPFSNFEAPEDVFNDYWMNYLTADMARAAETKVPYRNLSEYVTWRNAPNLNVKH